MQNKLEVNVNVRQGLLIDKFLRYMELDSGKKLDKDREVKIKGGVCHGLAIAHSYMASTGKLEWWAKPPKRNHQLGWRSGYVGGGETIATIRTTLENIK